jgi:hypothetical protein
VLARWSLQGGLPTANAGDRITLPDAIEKQLGLKLEQKPAPTPVIVVESVNQKPSDNPPGVAEALPPIPLPTEFEVADVKLSGPDSKMANFTMQPGGRFVSKGLPLRFLISRAVNADGNDQIVGIPGWADTARFDITAKSPAGPGPAMMDMESLAPTMRSLLADRFRSPLIRS